MQTIGAWTKLPVLAALRSSVIFAVSHIYSLIGIPVVLSTGLMFDFVAWYTKGLEVSCAAHITNNMSLFYFMCLGLSSTQKGELGSMFFVIVTNILYSIIIVLVEKKFRKSRNF